MYLFSRTEQGAELKELLKAYKSEIYETIAKKELSYRIMDLVSNLTLDFPQYEPPEL
jgi:hypothetical protein